MGCDIHANIEVKYSECSWKYVAINIEIDRHYALFEKMAGVRGLPNNAIFLPRGIPADCDEIGVKVLEEISSFEHSHSWLTFKELKQACHLCGQEPFYIYMKALAKEYGEDSVRIIFGFDN